MPAKQLAQMIKESDNIVFFGGAGVSTESGVKDYRSKDGIYNTEKDFGVPPERILSRSFFAENPEVFYDFYRKYFMSDVKPNSAHKALAKLEEMGKLRAVITQNVDNLHFAAGSKNVIELHGNTREFYCNSCKADMPYADAMNAITNGGVPRCVHCAGAVRPRVVMYEEKLHEGVPELAMGYIANADMLIVGGASLLVNPAASFIRFFGGKHFVIINKQETPYDYRAELIVRENIGELLERTMAEYGRH